MQEGGGRRRGRGASSCWSLFGRTLSSSDPQTVKLSSQRRSFCGDGGFRAEATWNGGGCAQGEGTGANGAREAAVP